MSDNQTPVQVEHPNIHAAILGIMNEIGYVQKTKSDLLKYSYASEKELIAALRPSMLLHGVICYVLDITPQREIFTTTKGSAMNMSYYVGHVRFLHVKSGTYIDVQASGEGMDSGDKSSNKAATGLLKYALRQTFLIETGDDPDADSSDKMERKAAKKQKAEQQPETDEQLDAIKKQIINTCVAKGGQQNPVLMKLVKDTLGYANINKIQDMDVAQKLLVLVKAVEVPAATTTNEKEN